MSNFQLSKQADPNKIFLTKFSELEGRFDPNFYTPKFQKNKQNINKVNNNKLGSVAQFSNNTWNQKDFFINTFPYIEIGEIDTLTGSIRNINNIAIKEAPSRAKMIVINNDILISTTRPNRGAISLLKKEGKFIASTGFSVIRDVNTDLLSKDFLFYILRLKISLKQMEQRSSGGNYPAITQDELKKIKIPLPPKNIQAEIVAKMGKAYQNKKDKETQAQSLLDSIDDYLLGELGIDLPKQTDNSLKARIFIKKFSEIVGGRFDPFFNQPLFIQAEKNIISSAFNCSPLSLLVFPVSGVTYNATDETQAGHAILRGNNINLYNNELNFKKIRFIDGSLKLSSSSKLYKNDILMSSASGSKEHVGKVAFIEKDIDYYFGAFMSVLRSKKLDYSHKYLFNFLSSKIYRLMLFRFLGGTNINNVGFEKIKNFPIPLPPLEKQNEIAEHISQIRDQARQLQLEAKTELEQAKQEIEIMILGNKQ